jgi:hypothetical protein
MINRALDASGEFRITGWRGVGLVRVGREDAAAVTSVRLRRALGWLAMKRPLRMGRWRFGVMAACLLARLAHAGTPKPCVSAEQAARMINKEICISAHIYDVVELGDGTRFLDVCSPDTPDDKCRFTVVNLVVDRDDVGDLKKYRDQDVQIRGLVQPMHGRAGMVLSHVRQFYGGPPKFRPNPLLARGFDGEQSRAPVNDPNLKPQGGRRGFMNTRDQEKVR